MAAGGHTSGDAVAGVTIAFTILAVMGTVLRTYTRFGLSKMGGVDDIFIVVAAVLAIAMTVTMCIQVKYGMGRHQDSLTPHELLWSNVWFWASVWIYYLALAFAKLAILLQYLRIFPQEMFRKVSYALMAFITAYSLWTVFSAIFACRPINYFWLQNVDPDANGQCLSRLPVWFTNAGLNIFTDVAIAILPLPVIKSLNLPKRPKLALMFIFCLGGITCVVSLLRLQSLYAVSVSNDISWDNPMAALWSNLEVNIGIICSCLPTLKTCILRVFPRLFSSHKATESGRAVATIGGNASGPGLSRRKRDSIGLHFLSHGHNATEIYQGPGSDEDMERTQIRPGSAQDHTGKDDDHIQVTTVVQVEQEDSPAARIDSGRSDTESTRKLVREFPS